MKAISWRVVATTITATVVYVLTGEITFAATVGAVDTAIKFFVYFSHERLWNHIPYGRLHHVPEYHI